LKKILIADDEKSLRMLIAGTLEIGNFDVIESDNGIEALNLATTEKPDLIILDVMMPGLTGYQVCQKIKEDEQLRQIQIIILTAKGQQADKNTAIEAKADYYVAKPFSPAYLLSLVEEILGE